MGTTTRRRSKPSSHEPFATAVSALLDRSRHPPEWTDAGARSSHLPLAKRRLIRADLAQWSSHTVEPGCSAASRAHGVRLVHRA